ncbi:MAG: enolase C-terminal domain-like protein [Lachnospiraceae bacterium]|nr:enolase C-terminal domain-like protein [Lachnospiraceae bacterium]
MKSRTIKNIITRQVFSKRGHPGIEAIVKTEGGVTEKAMCTAGLSVGTHEVRFVYDGGEKWKGKGVQRAVHNANEKIVPHLIGLDVSNQGEIDYTMLNLCQNAKETLGGNAIAAISAAVLKAGAKSLDIPLYRHIGGEKACVLPVPSSPAITGTRRYGSLSEKHGTKPSITFQCYDFPSFEDASYAAWEIHQLWSEKMKKAGVWPPDPWFFFDVPPGMYRDDLELFEMMADTIRSAGYENKVGIQIDVAADTYYCKEDGKYYGVLTPEAKDKDQMMDLYKRMVRDYPVIIIEDPFHEEDYDSHALLTREVDIQIVGDDLFTTNPERVKIGIQKGAANCVLLKVNQIGTITETLDMINLAYRNGLGVMPCESRGEGDTIADYSVGINAGTIRESAINETANRLLEIERELGQKAVFLGKRGLKGKRFQQ